MKIVMILEKALIDSIKIEKDKITVPGYLSGCIRQLKEKHQDLLHRSISPPEYLLFTANKRLLAFEDEFNKLDFPFNLKTEI